MMKKFTIVLTCIMALSLVACSGTSDEEKALLAFPLPKFTPSLDIKPSWKVSTSAEVEGVFSRLQPGMAYGKVYVAGTNGEVEARNLEDGKLVWKKKMDVIIESGVAVADRIVVVGSQEGEVIALDAETGEELWRNLVSSEIISPAAIGEDHVVVRTIDGKLFAMDEKTGKRSWFFDRNVPALTLRGTGTPILARGAVISGFDNGNVALFFMKDGALIWEKRIAQAAGRSEFDQIVDVDSKPLVVSDVLYVATYNGNIAAINLRDSQNLWQREMSSFQDLTSDGLSIFATTSNDVVMSLSREQGQTQWTQSELKNRKVSAPAALGKYVVVADFEGYLHWMSASDGHFVKRMRIDSSGVVGAPIAYLNYLVAQAKNGEVLAVKIPESSL